MPDLLDTLSPVILAKLVAERDEARTRHPMRARATSLAQRLRRRVTGRGAVADSAGRPTAADATLVP